MLFSVVSYASAAENQYSGKNMISKSANTNHEAKTVSAVKVSAKSVNKKIRSRNAPSSYKVGKGTGDCWDNSAVLYNQLKKSGKKVRIIQYKTSLSPRHRSVQVCENGRWVDYNYKGNGYAKLYYATKSKPGVHVIK